MLREREISLIDWFTPYVPATAGPGSGQRGAWNSIWISHVGVAGAQILQSAAFQGALAGSLTRS